MGIADGFIVVGSAVGAPGVTEGAALGGAATQELNWNPFGGIIHLI